MTLYFAMFVAVITVAIGIGRRERSRCPQCNTKLVPVDDPLSPTPRTHKVYVCVRCGDSGGSGPKVPTATLLRK